MLRTIITLDTQNISIQLPVNYIGRSVEVIAFAIDELNEDVPSDKKVLTHFASQKVLSKEWLSSEEDKAWQDL